MTRVFFTIAALAVTVRALPLAIYPQPASKLTLGVRQDSAGSCTAEGELACVDGAFGQCIGGRWTLTQCPAQQTCVYFTETNPGCDTADDAKLMGYSATKGGSSGGDTPTPEPSATSIGDESSAEESDSASEPSPSSTSSPTSSTSDAEPSGSDAGGDEDDCDDSDDSEGEDTGDEDCDTEDVDARELYEGECDPDVDANCVEVDEDGFEVVSREFVRRQLDVPQPTTASSSPVATSSATSLPVPSSASASDLSAITEAATPSGSGVAGSVETVTVTETVFCDDGEPTASASDEPSLSASVPASSGLSVSAPSPSASASAEPSGSAPSSSAGVFDSASSPLPSASASSPVEASSSAGPRFTFSSDDTPTTEAAPSSTPTGNANISDALTATI